MPILMKNREEHRVKEWVKEIKADKEKRKTDVRKETHQIAKEMAGYLYSKAKGRVYFY